MVKGKIHSLESFGTVDGPGVRYVVFMQGCPLRCQYCHNPDTWDMARKTRFVLTPDELMAEVLKYKNFISKGGVTVTGGEPLMQPQFVKEFFALCQSNGLHTTIDTSGHVFSDLTLSVLDNVNLVLLDIKTLDKELHKTLTGVELRNTLRFLDELEKRNIPVWIRHVIVPGLTDDDEKLRNIAQYIKKFKVVKKVELLPYHTMGEFKYKELNLNYPLKGIEPLSYERLENAKKIFKEEGLNL
ncbi:MAG: pyruvate formate lyase-activating protein [Bacteroidetes bacterium]|nr:pyruvate formate lyase-activating protein [Bacteroidota bacterium]